MFAADINGRIDLFLANGNALTPWAAAGRSLAGRKRLFKFEKVLFK